MNKPSKLWYIMPIVVGIIGGFLGNLIGLIIGISGGLFGYIVFRNKDKKMAKDLLIAGIAATILFFFGHVAAEVIFISSVISAKEEYYRLPPDTVAFEVSNPRLSVSTGILTLNITNKLNTSVVSIQSISYNLDNIDFSDVSFTFSCVSGCDSSGPTQNIARGANAEFKVKPYIRNTSGAQIIDWNENTDLIKDLNVGDSYSGIVKIGFMYGTTKFFESSINGVVEV